MKNAVTPGKKVRQSFPLDTCGHYISNLFHPETCSSDSLHKAEQEKKKEKKGERS